MDIEIVLEKTDTNYSAYSPTLAGCTSSGADRDTTISNMIEATKIHLEGMVEDGDVAPERTHYNTYNIREGF